MSRIVQVALLQNSQPPRLEVNDRRVDLPEEAWRHFRDIHRIQDLSGRSNVEIKVIDRLFSHLSRGEYFRELLSDLVQLPPRKIVLLDPDTGIAPTKYDAKHVTGEEIAAVWNCLAAGDWLLVYQHARRTKDWISATRDEFSQRCGRRPASTFQSLQTARDVAIFACKRLK